MFSLSTDRREGDKVRVKGKRLVSRRGCPRHVTPLPLRFIPRPSMPPRRAKRGVRLNPHIILRQAKASLRMISHYEGYISFNDSRKASKDTFTSLIQNDIFFLFFQ